MRTLKILLMLLILTGSFNFLYCQEWIKTFSGNQDIIPKQLIETYDKGYILEADFSWSGWQRIGWIIKTDINGNILWDKKLGNGTTIWAIGGVDKINDGGLVIVGITDTLDDSKDAFVAKLNSCGEVDWCRIFHTDNDPDYGIKILTLQDNTYILLLHNWGYEDKETVWLMHLDETGFILWEQEYFPNDTLGYPLYENDISLAPDNKYLVTGTCYHTIAGQTQLYWPWPMLIMAESTGEAVFEIPWGYTLPFPEQVMGEGYQSIINNGTIYSSICHYHWPDVQYSPCLIKTSLSGIPIYYKDLIDSTTFGKASTITKISDTTLMIGTGYAFSMTDTYTTILKSDTSGIVSKEKVLNHSEYLPQDAILNSDNKYLIMAPDYVNNHYIFYLWKLNLDLEFDSIYTQPRVYDSLCPDTITSGTLFFQCDVVTNVQEPVKNTEKVRMHIFPNPVREIVHVEMPECLQKETKTEHLTVTTIFHKWNKPMQLEVFDYFGKLIYSQTVQPSEKEISLDVSGWNPGIYFFRLIYGDTMVACEKLVVE
jgi:hypothetical protein